MALGALPKSSTDKPTISLPEIAYCHSDQSSIGHHFFILRNTRRMASAVQNEIEKDAVYSASGTQGSFEASHGTTVVNVS